MQLIEREMAGDRQQRRDDRHQVFFDAMQVLRLAAQQEDIEQNFRNSLHLDLLGGTRVTSHWRCSDNSSATCKRMRPSLSWRRPVGLALAAIAQPAAGIEALGGGHLQIEHHAPGGGGRAVVDRRRVLRASAPSWESDRRRLGQLAQAASRFVRFLHQGFQKPCAALGGVAKQLAARDTARAAAASGKNRGRRLARSAILTTLTPATKRGAGS